ncbi:MAG TPA: LCP family protein [Pseudonocardiaceae bacterium]|nr:LCP family protein [Pseudonocardiaceae bacterium]
MDVDAESEATPTAEPGTGPVPEAGVVPDQQEVPEPVVPEQAKSQDDVATAPAAEATAGPAPEPEPESEPEPEVTAAPVVPRWQRPSTSSRVLYGVGRSLIALTAAAVLTLTAYNWSILHQLDQGIARTDVFGNTAPAPTGPAPVVPPPLTSDVNILLVGMDSRTDPHGNPLPADELAILHAGPDTGELDTDTMILLHVPAGGQQAVAISFPRDSYVQIAGGYGKHRLNSAFAYAHNAEASHLRAEGQTNSAQIEQEADTAGRKNLIATIEQLIGNTVTINRYAEINLAGFYDMAKAVGGVEVCLKAATHDSQTHASFPAGLQTLTGVQALNFVRERHGLPGGDLDRIVRQQVFLGSLANKVLSTGTLTSPTKIAALTKAMQNSITLSSGWDIESFAEQMQGLTRGAIQFHTIPTGPNITVGGADVTAIDPGDVADFVRNLVADAKAVPTTTPAPPATSTATSTSPTVTTTTPVTTPVTRSGATDTAPITADGLRCVN